MLTISNFIYNEFNKNFLNYIYKSSTLVELNKHRHLITVLDNDRNTKHKQKMNVIKFFAKKVFYMRV